MDLFVFSNILEQIHCFLTLKPARLERKLSHFPLPPPVPQGRRAGSQLAPRAWHPGRPGLCMTRKRGTAAPPSTGPPPGQRFSATPGPPCPAVSSNFSLKCWSLGCGRSTRVLARGKVGKVLWSQGGVVRSSWGGGGGGGSDSHRTPRDSSRICGFEGQQAVGEHGQGHWGATWHYRGGVGGSLNRTCLLLA